MTHDSKELLACPFCGGEDLTVYEHKTVGSWVACISCGLETPTETGTTPDDATKYWNTRPAPQPRMRAEGEAKQLATRLIGYVQARPEYSFDLLLMHVSEAISMFMRDLPAASPAEASSLQNAQRSDGAEGAGDIARCIETIEKSYAFASGNVPLERCGEWIFLKRLLAVPPNLPPDDLSLWCYRHPKEAAARIREKAHAAPPKPAPDAMRLTEEERHAIGHARYQVQHASPEKSGCCFHYDLVKDLLRVIDRSAPVPAPDGAAEPDDDWEARSERSYIDNTKLPPSDDVRSALATAREEIVLTIAFLGRDAGSDRIGSTITGLIARLSAVDKAIIAALRSAPVSAPGTFEQLARHFETRKYGADRYLFPDEIASEIRQFAPAPAVGVTREAIQFVERRTATSDTAQGRHEATIILKELRSYSPVPDATVSD